MTSTQWHRQAAVGIALEATVLTGAIAMDGTAETGTTSIPTTVDQHDDQLVVGTGQALLPSAARSDVLERLGERSSNAIRDTYYEAVDVLAVLLTECGPTPRDWWAPDRRHRDAHPALWDRRKRDLLEPAARTADFHSHRPGGSSGGGEWAPVDGRPTLPEGVLLILNLESDRTVNASLLEPDGRGLRLTGSAIVRGEVALRETVSGLLTTAGRRRADRRRPSRGCGCHRLWSHQDDRERPRRAGTRPGPPNRCGGDRRGAQMARPPRTADAAPPAARRRHHGAAGGVRRRLRRLRRPRTRWLCQAKLGQEIYQFRMRIHPPAPAGAEAVVLHKAEALVATSPGGS